LQPITGQQDFGPFNSFLPVKQRDFGLYRAVYCSDSFDQCKNTFNKGIERAVICVRKISRSKSQFPEEKKNDQFKILIVVLALIGVLYSITEILQSKQQS